MVNESMAMQLTNQWELGNRDYVLCELWLENDLALAALVAVNLSVVGGDELVLPFIERLDDRGARDEFFESIGRAVPGAGGSDDPGASGSG